MVALLAGVLLAPPATFANPLGGGADPSLVWDGARYALTYTTGGDVQIKTAATLGGLREAKPQVVYRPPGGTAYSRDVWAPEISRDGDRWIVLFTADDGHDETHRLYVLRSKGKDVRGPYDFLGQVPTSVSTWAIDGFYFRHPASGRNSRLYLFWSGRVKMSDPQRIYVQGMKDSMTPLPGKAGEAVAISEPTYDWERVGWPVNEGPAAISHGRAVTLTYAAAGGTTLSYCLGRLFNPSGDLLNPKAWHKDPRPAFYGAAGMSAPGHNSFFRAKDGTWWNVFHAKREAKEGWGGRITAVQPVSFSRDGKALLGAPAGWNRSWPEPR